MSKEKNQYRKSFASSPEVRQRMQSVGQKDTPKELAVRKILFGKGYRYRINCKPLKNLNRKADIIFIKYKLAIFIDGCFWHLCPKHGSIPNANRKYWENKLYTNVQRDKETNEILQNNGWIVLRFWEHDDPNYAANAIICEIDRIKSVRPSQ